MAKDKKKIKPTENLAKDIERKPRLGPTPVQDLQLLDQVAAQAPVPRQVHVQVQQAISRISLALIEREALKRG